MKSVYIAEQLEPEFESVPKHQKITKPKRRRREKQNKMENR